MTIAIPGLRRTAPKHRAIDRVAHLEHQLAGAGEFISRLKRQLREADEHIERQAAELRHTASQLGTAVVEGMESAGRIADLEEQQGELTELRSRVANLNPFSVLQVGARDIDPDDQSTEPIDVRELRDYVNTTPDAWRPRTVTAVRRDVPATPIEVLTLQQQFALGARKVTVTGGPFRASA